MLRGEAADARLMEVTLALGAEVMRLAGLAQDEGAARAALTTSLSSGAAAERFARMVASLGGPADFMEKPVAYLAKAPVVIDVAAASAGQVTAIDTRAVGFTVVMLGGGRTSPEQSVNPAVGLDRLVPVGAVIRKGEPIARVHAADLAAADEAAAVVAAAFTLGEKPPIAPPLVERIIACP
jgi:thymidine phosphorylase